MLSKADVKLTRKISQDAYNKGMAALVPGLRRNSLPRPLALAAALAGGYHPQDEASCKSPNHSLSSRAESQLKSLYGPSHGQPRSMLSTPRNVKQNSHQMPYSTRS